ncbi:hypothetical protein ACIQ48_30260, partial [Bacillus mycoides]
RLSTDKTGWQKINGKEYYFGQKGDGAGLAEGQLATGWQTINGKKYYFGKSGDGSNLAEGQIAKGWFKVGNDRYYAEHENGILNFETIQADLNTYFFDRQTGKFVFLIRKKDHGYYGYDASKILLLHGFYEHNGKTYYFNNDGMLEERTFIDWQKLDGKWYYFGKKDDGSGLAEGQWATGFQTINGKTYYFGKNGEKLLDGSKLAEGQMATGWFQVGNDWYRADTDGKLNLGILEWGSEGKYFFDKTTGNSLFSTRKSGDTYYGYGPGGSNAILIHGLYEFDGKKYYFGKSGDGDKLFDGSKLAEGQMATGWFQVGNDWYRAETDGTLSVGILEWRGDKSFFDKTTGKYVFSIKKIGDKYYGYGPSKDVTLLHGFYEFDGKKYYFGKKDDGSGLGEGQMATGSRMIDGKAHYFNDNGIEEKRAFEGFQTIGGKTYYFGKKDDGSGLAEGQMATGFQTIDGKKYYFGKSGDKLFDGSKLAEGQMATGWFQVRNDWYNAGKDGTLYLGTQNWHGNKYFFDKSNGKHLFSIRKQVLTTDRGQTYIYKGYNADGYVTTGEHVTSEGTHYWFSKNGFMQHLFFLNGKLHIQTLEHGIPKNTTKLIKVGTSASKEKTVSYSAVFASPSLTETF